MIIIHILEEVNRESFSENQGCCPNLDVDRGCQDTKTSSREDDRSVSPGCISKIEVNDAE